MTTWKTAAAFALTLLAAGCFRASSECGVQPDGCGYVLHCGDCLVAVDAAVPDAAFVPWSPPGDGSCLALGEPCTAHEACCSRVCRPKSWGGGPVCIGPDECVGNGSICANSFQCCSGLCGQGCYDPGAGCRKQGATCSAADPTRSCCQGLVCQGETTHAPGSCEEPTCAKLGAPCGTDSWPPSPACCSYLTCYKGTCISCAGTEPACVSDSDCCGDRVCSRSSAGPIGHCQ